MSFRSRNIKPGFFVNEYLGTCEPIEALLFEGLWCIADRSGRLENRPLRIRGQIFPYRNISALEITRHIQNLSSNGFLIEYEVDGVDYIEICNFDKHQNPHKNEKASEIPSPESGNKKVYKSTGCEKSSNYATNPVIDGIAHADSLIPDSLIPDSLIPDSLKNIPDSLKNTVVCKKPKITKKNNEKFDLFWKSLVEWQGAKGTKREALTEFEKINPDDDLLKIMIDGYQRQVEHSKRLKSLGQFSANFKHVCRWVRYREWENEIPSLDAVVSFKPQKLTREQSIELANQQAADDFAKGIA